VQRFTYDTDNSDSDTISDNDVTDEEDSVSEATGSATSDDDNVEEKLYYTDDIVDSHDDDIPQSNNIGLPDTEFCCGNVDVDDGDLEATLYYWRFHILFHIITVTVTAIETIYLHLLHYRTGAVPVICYFPPSVCLSVCLLFT